MCSTVDSTAKCVLCRPAEIMWGWVAVVANVPLFNIEQWWTMLNNVEQCWTMLNNIEQCWTMLNNVDSTVFNSDSPHCAKACSPQYTSSFLNFNFIIHHVQLDIAEKCFQLYSKVDYCAVLIVRLYEDCTTLILYSVLLVRWLYDNCTTRILYSVLIVLYADPILATIVLYADPAHLSADYCLLPWWISYWTGQIGQRAICELRHVITSLFNKLTVQYSKSKSSKLKSKFWVHNAGLFWHIEVESFSGTHDRINCKFCCCSVFKFLRDLVSLLFWGVYWIGVPRGLP